MRTLVVNFAAGSGTGKSTTAASVFARLKRVGVNCELALEFAKEKTWERNTKIFDDQCYILGKQNWKLHRLQGEVDVVITDSPLFLSLAYNTRYMNLDKFALEAFNQYYNLNIFLNRSKDYEPKGRHQTLEEAKQLDEEIKELMDSNRIPYHTFNTTEEDEIRITTQILTCIDRTELISSLRPEVSLPEVKCSEGNISDSKVLEIFILQLLDKYLPARDIKELVASAKVQTYQGDSIEASGSNLYEFAKDIAHQILETNFDYRL